jgi:hypothetical protein
VVAPVWLPAVPLLLLNALPQLPEVLLLLPNVLHLLQDLPQLLDLHLLQDQPRLLPQELLQHQELLLLLLPALHLLPDPALKLLK